MLSVRPSNASFAIGSVKDINFDGWPDDQLKSSLEDALRKKNMLTLENDVFERYLRRRDPHSLHKLEQVMESAWQAQKILPLRASHFHPDVSQPTSLASLPESVVSIASAHRTRDKASVSFSSSIASASAYARASSYMSTGAGRGGAKELKITVGHRIELTIKETEDLKRQFDEFEKSIVKTKSGLKVRMNELKQRIRERKEAVSHFQSKVINNADPITKKLSLDNFIRFIDNEHKIAASIIDKLNLKLITTKRLICQTKKQILQQQDMGNVLRPIDFEKLRIENEQLIEFNDLQNRNLYTQKRISGHYNLVLKNRKEKLLERKSKVQSIERSLVAKKREKVDLRRCKMLMSREVERALAQYNNIKRLQEDYEIPEIEDFLHSQRQLQDAKKECKRLKRQRKLQLFPVKLRTESRPDYAELSQRFANNLART